MIITITNQKGGIGKTTTTLNLAYGLHNKGYNVLMVDMDGQMNLSLSCGISKEELKSNYGIFDLLVANEKIDDCITNIKKNMDVIISTAKMHTLDKYLNNIGDEYKLAEALKSIANNYDFVLIDTPPMTNISIYNALTASERVIIPVQADKFSVEAVKFLVNNAIVKVKQYTNKKLVIDGLLMTRYNARNILTQETTNLFSEIAKQLNTKLYNAKIRENIAIKESQFENKDIFTYDNKSIGAIDYMEFVNEFLKDI